MANNGCQEELGWPVITQWVSQCKSPLCTVEGQWKIFFHMFISEMTAFSNVTVNPNQSSPSLYQVAVTGLILVLHGHFQSQFSPVGIEFLDYHLCMS